MNMIKKLLLGILFFACLPFGQSQEVTVSQEVYLKNDFSYDILGRVEDRFLLFRDKVADFKLHAYDDDLQLKWEREVRFEKKRTKMIGIVPTDSVFNVFYIYKEKGEHIIKMQRMDANARMLDSVRLTQFKDFLTPKYAMKYSEDREKVLIFSNQRDHEINAIVFDLANMKVLWDKKVLFEKGFANREFRKISVSNKGNLLIVIERDNNKFSRKKHRFKIYEYNRFTDQVYSTEIPLNFLTYHIKFELDNVNSTLTGVGLYTEKNIEKAEGLFFVKVPLTGQTNYTLNRISFDDETIEDIYGTDIRKKRKKGINDLAVQKIILRKDGGVLAVTELNKVYYRRSSYASPLDRGSGNNWADYYFEDILAVSLHPDGKLHWKKVLHKKQYSQDDDGIYSSFFVMKNPSRVRLIFNDEIRNENTVSEYVVQGNGKTARKSVMTTDYQRLKLRFQEAVQIASNEIIVPSERNGKLNLVKITY